MNIVVAGGAGYIGTNLCCELVAQGHRVICVDNFCRAVSTEDFLESRGVKVINADLSITDNIRQNFTGETADIVFHLAGYKDVQESFIQPELYRLTNVSITSNIVLMAKQLHASRIVFSSTAAVYASSISDNVKENDLICPSSPYGEGKYSSEMLLKNFACDSNSTNVVVLRYFNPVGFGILDYSSWKNPSSRTLALWELLVRKILIKDYSIRIFRANQPKGKFCFRDFVDIRDLIDSHLIFLKHTSYERYEIFNVGTGVPTDVGDFINAFEDAFKIKFDKAIHPPRSGEIPISYANVDKIRRIGWTNRYDVLGTIDVMVESILRGR